MAEVVRTREQVMDDLAENRQALEAVPSLYAKRLALWKEAQALPERILQRELADLSGVSVEAVVLALRNDRLEAAHANGEHATTVKNCPACNRAKRGTG